MQITAMLLTFSYIVNSGFKAEFDKQKHFDLGKK